MPCWPSWPRGESACPRSTESPDVWPSRTEHRTFREIREGLVPAPDDRPPNRRQEQAHPLGGVPAEHLLDPGVFPREPRNVQIAPERRGEVLHLADEIGALGVEEDQVARKELETGGPNALALLERAQILDVQPHRE